MEDVKVTRTDQRSRGLHAGQRVLPRRDRGPGLFVAAGFCAHGLAGAGGIGKVMAEWIAGGEPSLDLWHMDIRRFGAQYRSPALHAGAGARDLRDLLRHHLPAPRAQAGRPLRLTPPRLAPRARGGVRREVGLGAGELVRVQQPPTATGTCGHGAGPAATGRPPSRPSTRPAASGPRCSTSPRSPSWRSPGRVPRRCSSGCATTGSRATSGASPTPRCSTRAAGSSATSPSPAWARSASRSSPAPPFR